MTKTIDTNSTPMEDPSGASVHGEVLLQTTQSWNGIAYRTYPNGQPQLTVLKMTIPPRTGLPWHTHAIPNAAYILSGRLTIEDKGTGEKKTFHAGEALAESVDVAHRGVTGEEPAVVIIVYAGAPGIPTSTPLPGGKPEY